MPTRRKEAVEARPTKVEVVAAPRSAVIAEGGISTARDFVKLMGALMADVVTGRITPQVGQAAVNAGGKLLKVVELQHKFGKSTSQNGKSLNLLDGTD